jgi:uncharacterized membrane protein
VPLLSVEATAIILNQVESCDRIVSEGGSVMDTHRRSIAKALSWRITAFLITFIVVFLVTGQTDTAVGIGVVDSLIKIVVYYAHERMWFRIPFGRGKPLEYEI